MSSRKIEDLHELMQPIVRDFLQRVDEMLGGYQAFITDGYRSNEEQNQLYAQGRSIPGNIVTNAKAGESPHNYGLAIDIAFRPDGSNKAEWNTEMYQKIQTLANELGLTWGGSWTGFTDKPHYELKNWRDIISRKEKPMPETTQPTTDLMQIEKKDFEKLRANSETFDLVCGLLGINRNSDINAVSEAWQKTKDKIINETKDNAKDEIAKSLSNILGLEETGSYVELADTIKGLIEQSEPTDQEPSEGQDGLPESDSNTSEPLLEKDWFKSKMNWFNLVMTLINSAGFVLTLADRLPESVILGALLVQGIGNIILRTFFTKTAIKMT